LSSLEALTPARLEARGVTQVISAMVEICVEDLESADLGAHFDAVADRIAREARKGGRSLVHCVAGVSRSPTLVLAYLVKHAHMTLAEAYDHVRSLRPCICPNAGFWRQLIAYEIARRGTSSLRVTTSSPSSHRRPQQQQWNGYLYKNHLSRY
uniref:Protein-tyrosine-phosphatase n=1 Tax=Hymenolepis diminuta TaxID=6216 RepID=A0A0R3SDP4_HYMDI